MNRQPMLVRKVAEDAVVVVNRQVTERLAEVVQEPIADRTRVHNAACQNREERKRIITAALAELLAQGGRPVERLDLPTVRVEILQGLASERAGVSDERLDHRVPVPMEGARIQYVQRVDRKSTRLNS